MTKEDMLNGLIAHLNGVTPPRCTLCPLDLDDSDPSVQIGVATMIMMPAQAMAECGGKAVAQPIFIQVINKDKKSDALVEIIPASYPNFSVTVQVSRDSGAWGVSGGNPKHPTQITKKVHEIMSLCGINVLS